MKRILCLIENLGSGGAERQLTCLAVLLKQKGYEVEVCYYIKKEFYLPYLQENRVDSCFLPEASSPQSRFFALRKHIKSYKPDVVLSYSVSTSLIACLLKACGAKFHLIVSERSTTQCLDKREKLKFFFYRWANFIVSNSHFQGQFIIRNCPGLSAKVKVITNFVDTDKFKPNHEMISRHSDVRMICVGSLMRPKNVPSFVEAVNKVIRDGYRLYVDWYGKDLGDDYSKEVHDKLKMLPSEEYFVLHTPSDSIHNEYCNADVFCLPSIYEGFPNVLCEAMSCGLPVLCSSVSDVPRIMEDGVNGFLFNPLSVDDMASAIERFLDLPLEKRMEMGVRSREIVLASFSAEDFINSYCELL